MKLAKSYIRQTSNGVDFIKKILGLILLFGGLIVILYGLYSSYNIFTAKTAAPEVFKIETQGVTVAPGAQGAEAQMQKIIQEQLKGILPAESIFGLLNLIAWSIFAGILIVGGGQISSLGIKLIRT